MIYSTTINGFVISTDKSKLDVNMIHQYLSQETYWAPNIPIEIVKQSIEGSICFGLYLQDKQIGFTRVITDKATFGYLADVFITEAFRGKGLAKLLMQFVMDHPELQQLRSWMLATRDAHQLYQQFGFAALENPQRFMRRSNFTNYNALKK